MLISSQKKSSFLNSSKIKTYSGLRAAIRSAIRLGRKRAEKAVEREKVHTSWEIGKLVFEHVLLNKSRAGYGQAVVRRLSRDLDMSMTQLKYMIEFARTYSIGPPVGQLSWSHYQTLLSVNDDQKRNAIAKRAAKEGWTRRRLQSEVKKFSRTKKQIRYAQSQKLKEPALGRPGAKIVIKAKSGIYQGKLVYDLGFSNYYRPKRGLQRPRKKALQKDFFVYRVKVLKVVDGDTFWAEVSLGFGFVTQQKLRFRAINAPEVISKQGRLAKNYLTRKLRGASKILIKTEKSDKFDRYLADVWVDGEYINQTLVTKGYAKVVKM